MPFDHKKLMAHQKRMEFPAVEMPSKMIGHTLTAKKMVGGALKPESFGDFEQERDKEQEQEQEQTLTPICQSVTSLQL